jgi:hypothetical protein
VPAVDGGHQRRPRAGQDVGNGALAEGQAEHLDHQLDEALKANRLSDMEMDDER